MKRRINNVPSAHQGILENALNTIFPNNKAIKEVRKEIKIINPDTGDYLEVDVWYPELHLCFEFQDDYHYLNTWKSQLPLSTVQEKDSAKRSLLLQRGETLVIIPCWWDCSLTSLKATISFHRPDLLHFPTNRVVDIIIPINPPPHFFPSTKIQGKVELMLASFPASPEALDLSEQNPWWLGEKYDGVRCYWNPEEKQLYSRHGLRILVPPSISLSFSPFGHTVLDGEIWCGRGLFAEANTVALAAMDKVNWSLFKVVCFDEASRQMNKKPFERRYSLLLSHIPSSHPVVIIASRLLCFSSLLLSLTLQLVEWGGGEGIILRKPRSKYSPGRSTLLLKIKTSPGDQEALVMNVEEDGSLLLQLPSESSFIVPKEDCVLYRRAVRGDIVTFTHAETRNYISSTQPDTHEDTAHDDAHTVRVHAGAQGITRGAHAKRIVFRIRNDVSWEDVLLHYHKDKSQSNLIEDTNIKKKRYSKFKRERTMRGKLENLAREQGFDPLIAENWYCVNRPELLKKKEIAPIISHYGSSLIQALIDLFPDLNLHVSKFVGTPHKFWENVNNRRELFKKFAYSKGGDPSDKRFWLSAKTAKMHRSFRGMKGVLLHYKGFYDAVSHLFPELHLTRTAKFRTFEDRKSFFYKFAFSRKFDPLVPSNWYSVSYSDLSQQMGFKQVINYYGGDLSDCLMHLYPSIGLQKSLFGVKKRREIFEKFAKIKNEDSVDAEFWYSLNPLEFRKYKSMKEVVKYYGGYPQSVIRLFPELRLKKIRFIAPK